MLCTCIPFNLLGFGFLMRVELTNKTLHSLSLVSWKLYTQMYIETFMNTVADTAKA